MNDKEFIAKIEELGGKKLTEEELKEFAAMSEVEKAEAMQSFEDLTGLADAITNMSDEEKAQMKASMKESQELMKKMAEEGYVEDLEEDYEEDMRSTEEIEADLEKLEKELAERKTFWGRVKRFFRFIF